MFTKIGRMMFDDRPHVAAAGMIAWTMLMLFVMVSAFGIGIGWFASSLWIASTVNIWAGIAFAAITVYLLIFLVLWITDKRR